MTWMRVWQINILILWRLQTESKMHACWYYSSCNQMRAWESKTQMRLSNILYHSLTKSHTHSHWQWHWHLILSLTNSSSHPRSLTHTHTLTLSLTCLGVCVDGWDSHVGRWGLGEVIVHDQPRVGGLHHPKLPTLKTHKGKQWSARSASTSSTSTNSNQSTAESAPTNDDPCITHCLVDNDIVTYMKKWFSKTRTIPLVHFLVCCEY